MSIFGNNATAGYPQTLYPAYDFFGPQSPQPGGGANAESDHRVSPQERTHMMLVIAGIAVIGLVAWHLNFVK